MWITQKIGEVVDSQIVNSVYNLETVYQNLQMLSTAFCKNSIYVC